MVLAVCIIVVLGFGGKLWKIWHILIVSWKHMIGTIFKVGYSKFNLFTIFNTETNINTNALLILLWFLSKMARHAIQVLPRISYTCIRNTELQHVPNKHSFKWLTLWKQLPLMDLCQVSLNKVYCQKSKSLNFLQIRINIARFSSKTALEYYKLLNILCMS